MALSTTTRKGADVAMTARIRTHIGTLVWLLAVFAAGMTLLLVVGARPTSAYEGPFCAEEMRAEGDGCVSVLRSSIRRAIGHTTDGYANVQVEAGKEALGGYCRTIECTANSGYIGKDGSGYGYVWNEGPNGSRRVDGYLYP